MKHIAAGLALILASTQPSLALSCLKPDAVRSYLNAVASETRYYILNGSFNFKPPKAAALQGVTQSFTANFRGDALARLGFKSGFERQINVTLSCAGPWCGQLDPDQPYIAFVELAPDNRLTFTVDPCGSLAFKDPSAQTLKHLEICAQGGACAPQEN
ncbi:MAG: hypothetical protein AAF340_03905 [Pseudomonadota bacterium]